MKTTHLKTKEKPILETSLHLFIYGLFNDVISNSDYRPAGSNARTINGSPGEAVEGGSRGLI
jgi:hypothetical protein